jgi:hypothetical protein
LFHLKEILVAEQANQIELILQVFWGLLACEILNQKERGVIENTTLKRIKEISERLLNEQWFNY